MVKSDSGAIREFLEWAVALFIAALFVLSAVAFVVAITEVRQIKHDLGIVSGEAAGLSDGCEAIDP